MGRVRSGRVEKNGPVDNSDIATADHRVAAVCPHCLGGDTGSVHEGNRSNGLNLLTLSALLQCTCPSLTYRYTYYVVSFYYYVELYIFIISLVCVCLWLYYYYY